MDPSFLHKLATLHQQCPTCPSIEGVYSFYRSLLAFLFPEHAVEKITSAEKLLIELNSLERRLQTILRSQPDHMEISKLFFDRLPIIRERLDEDVSAMFEGDPAAKTRTEVIRTYPGFYAIAAYRVAHELHLLGVTELPRMITEHAHSKTGIDIHPAADIGRFFCIDHGTGIVIGETTVIGAHVKLYQGVTLGALSVSKSDAARKRHPTIGDKVVIYAGATILGGSTEIGADSVIGGNVWLTRSVPSGSKVYYQANMSGANGSASDLIIIKHESDEVD